MSNGLNTPSSWNATSQHYQEKNRIIAAWLVVGICLLAILTGSGLGLKYMSLEQTEIACLGAFKNRLPLTIRGVRIHYCYNRQLFFSSNWLSPPISGEGGQIDLQEALRVTPSVKTFLETYSQTFLSKNLGDIYLMGELLFFGTHYGGTYGQSSVFIEVRSVQENYTDDYVTSQLHAEFSSILMNKYPFPSEAWTSVNENGFKYSDNAVEMLSQDGIFDQSDYLLKEGFLSKYSTSNLENDFNDIAFEMFNQPSRLSNLAKGYEKIRQKVNLAVQFYKEVDPGIQIDTCFDELH